MGLTMNVHFREVAKLWLYAFATLIALTACGWVYIHVGPAEATYAVIAVYTAGCLLTYWSGGNPDISGVYGTKALWGVSILWFVVLAIALIGATLCLLFMHAQAGEGAVELPDIF